MTQNTLKWKKRGTQRHNLKIGYCHTSCNFLNTHTEREIEREKEGERLLLWTQRRNNTAVKKLCSCIQRTRWELRNNWVTKKDRMLGVEWPNRLHVQWKTMQDKMQNTTAHICKRGSLHFLLSTCLTRTNKNKQCKWHQRSSYPPSPAEAIVCALEQQIQWLLKAWDTWVLYSMSAYILGIQKAGRNSTWANYWDKQMLHKHRQ